MSEEQPLAYAVASSPHTEGGRTVTRREVAALLAAAGGETALTVLAVPGYLPALLILVLHAVMVAVTAAILFAGREPGADRSLAFVVLLLVATAGPAGVLVLLSSLFFVHPRPEGQEVIDAWYERLARAGKPSSVTQTYDRIVSGRVQRFDTAAPLDFLEVIRSGDLEERQRALGLIARHFHPDYAPVLNAALRSTEPVVRVQAAAVVARVREDLKAKIAHLTREERRTPRQALEDAGLLHALQTCPLVASTQQTMCRDGVRRLMRGTFLPGDDILHAARRGTNADSLRALETFLISERRYRELRVLRRVRASLAASFRVIRRRGNSRGCAA